MASDVGVVPDQSEGRDDAALAAQAVIEIVESSAEPAAWTDECFAQRAIEAGLVGDESSVKVMGSPDTIRLAVWMRAYQVKPLGSAPRVQPWYQVSQK